MEELKKGAKRAAVEALQRAIREGGHPEALHGALDAIAAFVRRNIEENGPPPLRAGGGATPSREEE